MAPRFSRERALELTGATEEELQHFETQRLLVPNVSRWPPWSKQETYFTEGQIAVLRWLVKARRAGLRGSDASDG